MEKFIAPFKIHKDYGSLNDVEKNSQTPRYL